MTIGQHSDVAGTGSNITAKVTIGSYTSVGPHVQMHTLWQHPCVKDRKLVSTDTLDGYPPTYGEETITIGSDVWIGQNAVLLGDLTIGDGAIIGAFAVVAKDVPPYAVVVGNPAQIKRYRFTEEQIAKLLKIKWWELKHDIIRELTPYMMDVDKLIEYYENNPDQFRSENRG